jgi:hypothetical protein
VRAEFVDCEVADDDVDVATRSSWSQRHALLSSDSWCLYVSFVAVCAPNLTSSSSSGKSSTGLLLMYTAMFLVLLCHIYTLGCFELDSS